MTDVVHSAEGRPAADLPEATARRLAALEAGLFTSGLAVNEFVVKEAGLGSDRARDGLVDSVRGTWVARDVKPGAGASDALVPFGTVADWASQILNKTQQE